VGKQTGRPGVCFVTRGPGATNAAHGVHIARQSASPMILFAGQVDRGVRGREAWQELDYPAVFGSMAKWAAEIDDADRIPEMVSRAFHVAMSGQPGPVVLALPHDMLLDATDAADGGYAQAAEPAPAADEMARLQALLGEAASPLVLLGGSGWDAAAREAVMRFAERFELPVATG